MTEIERRVLEVLATILDRGSLRLQVTPDWLNRPGKRECGPLWDKVSEIYSNLADGLKLPEVMPPRESRYLDGLIEADDGGCRLVEVDECQHFNPWRLMTLRQYPPGVRLGFPAEIWASKSDHCRKLQGGGFAAPRPPLFPMPGGRHRQRAFRDALADLLPSIHGYAPTIRIADFEVKGWIWDKDAARNLERLIENRLT